MSSDDLRVGMAADHVEQQLVGFYAFANHLSEIAISINTAVAHDWEPSLANFGTEALQAAHLMVRGGPVAGSISYATYLANKRVAAEMALKAALEVSTASARVFELAGLLRDNMRDQVATSSDGEGYAESAMSTVRAKRIYDRALKDPSVLANMSPTQVAAWWRRLSPAQQAEFLQSRSGAASGSGVSPTSEQLMQFIERITTAFGNELLAVDIGTTLASVLGAADLPGLERLLGPVGIVLGGYEAFQALQDGEYLNAFLHAIPAGTDLGLMFAAGTPATAGAAASLGPLSLGVSALVGFVDITLPVTAEEQDETYAMGARHMFGESVDPNHLTSEQATAMSQRYAGAWGCVTMISDTMDATAEKIFPWNW